MKWIEAEITTNTAGTEAVCAILIGLGIEGQEIVDDAQMQRFIEANPLKWDYVDDALLARQSKDVLVRFYISDTKEGRELLVAIKQELGRLGQAFKEPDMLGSLSLQTKYGLDDTQWLESWKEHYKPLRVGQNIVIRPVWEEYSPEPEDVVFSIEPGHVFGTGLHESTTLCLSRLEQLGCSGCNILDIGCGSGILSIVGLLLGGRQAVAIDIDSSAVDIAYKNAGLNGINLDQYTVVTGNILEDEVLRQKVLGLGHDIILANIVADVVIRLAEYVPAALNQGGSFIASGIIQERLEDVLAAFKANGLKVCAIDTHGAWAAVWTKL